MKTPIALATLAAGLALAACGSSHPVAAPHPSSRPTSAAAAPTVFGLLVCGITALAANGLAGLTGRRRIVLV